MTHESLALKLRVLRAERALTIEQAARQAGVTPETISDAERGRRHLLKPRGLAPCRRARDTGPCNSRCAP